MRHLPLDLIQNSALDQVGGLTRHHLQEIRERLSISTALMAVRLASAQSAAVKDLDANFAEQIGFSGAS